MNRAEAIAEARRLFTAEQYTYEECSAAVGVPVSTLEKRGSAEAWSTERETRASYAATIRALKFKLLEKATSGLSVEGVSGDDAVKFLTAWKIAEAAFPEHRYAAAKEDPKARLAILLELLHELVLYLGTADRSLLDALTPHLEPFGTALKARIGAVR